MIRLDLSTAPYWLTMPSGVRVLVRPLTTAVNEFAKARMRRRAAELIDHRSAIEAAGGDVIGLPDPSDPDGLLAVSAALYAEALAVAAVVEWEGVGDAGGEPVPALPQHVAAWIAQTPGDAEVFVLRYIEPIARVAAEGNGSGPSPSGTSAAGPTIAEGAGTPAPSAPMVPLSTAPSAPISSTPPRRSRGPRPGT